MLFTSNNKDPGAAETRAGVLQRLKSGLAKTRTVLFTDVTDLFGKGIVPGPELLEEIETRLLLADVGTEAAGIIIDSLTEAARKDGFASSEDLFNILHQQMLRILRPVESPLTIPASPAPFIILVAGVNGAGKTTTIAKLANLYRDRHKVLLAAGDTFRAAAIDQLKSWGDRIDVPVVAHAHGADAAAVIYDGLVAARKTGVDIVIADTAGRLQNKSNLIDELKKIRRTISKFDSEVPVETLLVLDAGNGQNALSQARQFHDAIGVTGLALTKLDGTAKGGIIFALATKLGIPVRFITTGEGIDDIAVFNANNFVTALLSQYP
jgi:fused signal recognition particle receptor